LKIAAAFIALAMLVPAAVGNAQTAKPAASSATTRDWSNTVTRTAGGAFLPSPRTDIRRCGPTISGAGS
jgi:hypothetical protein